MKFIYFLVVVAIIYFLATQIKVTHVDSLPRNKQEEIDKKSKIRSIISENYIREDPLNRPIEHFGANPTFGTNKLVGYTNEYSADQYDSPNYKDNYWDLTRNYVELPNASNLYMLIKSEYQDSQYKFNVANLPVTTRSPNRNTQDVDAKYLKHVKRNIAGWNRLFYKYYPSVFTATGYPNQGPNYLVDKKLLKVRSMKLVLVMETADEFFIKVDASLGYLGKSMHFQLTYYGHIYKNDEFLNGATDVYALQLVDIRPILKSDYELQPNIMDEQDSDPFMSMEEQLRYVNRINKLHWDENEEP